MSCSCGNNKNRTPAAAIDQIRKLKKRVEAELGAGFFVVADPSAGPLQYKKIIVHDLSYVETQLRGLDCTAFKWLPYVWITRKEIDKIPKFQCSGQACSKDKDCEKENIACVCVYGGTCF